jgi:hypothetical protein
VEPVRAKTVTKEKRRGTSQEAQLLGGAVGADEEPGDGHATEEVHGDVQGRPRVVQAEDLRGEHVKAEDEDGRPGGPAEGVEEGHRAGAL